MKLAIIGGGRWGRVHLSVAQQLGFSELSIVSQHQAEKIPAGVRRVASMEALLATPPDAAIVANRAADHFTAASALLDAGVHVMLEKPATLVPEETEQLIAKSKGRCLLPALNYRFCSYLRHFAELIDAPRHIVFRWADAPGEVRYGEAKHYDATISVGQDVIPHVVSIFSVLFPGHEFTLTSHDGHLFQLRAGELTAEVSLARAAAKRERFIQIGDGLSLDFTGEPGTVTRNGTSFSADNDWASRPSPLAQQLHYFKECVARGHVAPEDTAILRSSVALAAACA